MKRIFLCGILVFAAGFLFAAEYGGVTASPYLNLGVGARASGMGEAYTAVVDTVDSVLWNPGALVKVENPQFSMMHNQNFGGTSYEYLSVGFPAEMLGLDIWGTIGITALLVRVGDIQQTKEEEIGGEWVYSDNYITEQGEEYYGAGGTVLGVAYSWQAAKMFSVGATLKLINQKIAIEEGWIPALDFGILAHTNLEGFDIGMNIQNVTFMEMDDSLDVDSPDAPLPLNLKFGLSYKAPRLFTSENDPRDAFIFAIDGVLPLQPPNLPFRLHTGFEYMFDMADIKFTPRMGYRFNGNDFVSDLGWFAGFTFGFGIGKNFAGVDLSVDYSYVPFGVLGDSHRMGMMIAVGEPTPTPTPDPVKPPKVVKLKPQAKKIWVMWSIDKKNLDKIKGYNVYMSYKPGGKYYKLTKTPLSPKRYYLKVGPLKSGLRSYFVVTTVNKKGKESKFSREISAVPR